MTIEYFVEYTDFYGNRQSEIWTEDTLNEELTKGEVKITYITLASSILEKLGLED